MTGWLCWGSLICGVTSGLVAGVFLGFSNFIMGALGRLPAAQGAAAMQSINIVVINPVFLTLLLGTGLACLALAGFGALRLDHSAGWLLMIGGLAYALGCAGVTMVFNVPLNNALAAADPNAAGSAGLWASYLKDWTFWNTVRTVSAAIGMVLLILAWRALSRPLQ